MERHGDPVSSRSTVALLIAMVAAFGWLSASCAAKTETSTSPATAAPQTRSSMRDPTAGLGSRGSAPNNKKTQAQTKTSRADGDTSGQTTGNEIKQWATRASATSSYGQLDGDQWNASQATGEPDVDPNCGDDGKAWAAKDKDTVETLTLRYATPVVPSELRVFQTYNPGQVVRMEMKGPSGQSKVIYEGAPTVEEGCPVEGFLKGLDVGFPVDTVLITIDQSKLGIGWAEIDAVSLLGTPAGTGTNASQP